MATSTAYAPNPIQEVILTDFTGGLNYRADAFQLADHESPDMLNVDLDPRGGFGQRDGVALLNATATSTPGNMWQYATTAGVSQVLIQQGNDFSYSTGGNFTAVNPDALVTTGIMRATTFKDLNYIQRNAEQPAIKWDGAASTVLGVAFNDDLTAPTGANMIKAKCITTHKGYVFVANTVETGTAFTSRIRWSHPNQPADYRTNDYVDVDTGADGDQITALCSIGDQLLIFKANSVHVLTGYDPSTFSVFPLTYTAGAISQEAVAATEFGIYFFSWPNGLMKYTPRGGVEWDFERLYPAISDGRIPSAAQAGITVGWVNRRVWVCVPWGGSSTNTRVFVLDPTLRKKKRYGTLLGIEGGWTAYDLPIGPTMTWHPPGSSAQFLAAHDAAGHVLKLHQSSLTTDTLTTAAGVTNITSYYVTRWLDAGNPSIIKRWKRPEIVIKGGVTGSVRVDVCHDFNPSEIKRTMHVSTAALSAAMLWTTDSWDLKVWGSDSASTEVITRLGVLGRSRAVQLTFTGPASPSIDWTIDAIFLKFIPRRLRG